MEISRILGLDFGLGKVMDTSPKSTDREGLGESHTGTSQHCTSRRVPNFKDINLYVYLFVSFLTDKQCNKTGRVHYPIRAASNQRVRERYVAAVLDIPGHETVLIPRETLQRLCDHLGVTCSEDFFEKFSKILYGTPSFTRNTVVSTEEQKERVTKMMKKYPFLKVYSFDKYPS